MVLFGRTHESFLREYIELSNGIPSHDTFNRVFSMLEPAILRQYLNDYGKDIVGLLAEKQICLDGKKLSGVSPASRGNWGLYIVNAWVAENRLRSYLKISSKTLQRLRNSGDMKYSTIAKKHYYKANDIKVMLERKTVKSGKAQLEKLKNFHGKRSRE